MLHVRHTLNTISFSFTVMTNKRERLSLRKITSYIVLFSSTGLALLATVNFHWPDSQAQPAAKVNFQLLLYSKVLNRSM